MRKNWTLRGSNVASPSLSTVHETELQQQQLCPNVQLSKVEFGKH